MVGVVIDITNPPFGHENTFAALYTASAALSKGLDVVVILRGDGVFTGRKGQMDPLKNINLPPTESQVEDILELDGRIVVEQESLEARGIDRSELFNGIEIVDSNDIHNIIMDHGDKVVTF
jgi:predicted peroxiredoxin